MTQELKNFKCVSSLVVFRKMYDNSQSIYNIISEFAKTIIISKKLTKFELLEMCQSLKEEFGVWIVPAVVKTALKKLNFLKRERDTYTLVKCLSQDEVKNLNEQLSQSKNTITRILDEYVKYYKSKQGSELYDESTIKDEFCKFIVEGHLVNESNIGLISGYIVDKKGDSDFEKACEAIREGLIIYNGLSYTTDGELVEKLDTPLTVFLETEILFHATGLNGILYQNLFSDFYKIVTDINNATIKQYGKKIISLCYFSETKKEVNRYFGQAASILKNQGAIDNSKPAMVTILNGCTSVADVKQKEIEFWNNLEKQNIKEDETQFDITNEYYAKYNLTKLDDVSEHADKEDKDKTYDIGQMTSKVNYLRRNTNRNIFRVIKAIILTGNSKTLSFSDNNTTNQEVPYATTLGYLTNRFWYSLHKGIFADNNTIPGPNIITMAQVAFSQKVNDSLSTEYNKIKQQFENGELTQEKANEIIIGFKANYLKPENVTKELVDQDFCFDLFNGEAIEQAKAERTLERQRHTEEVMQKEKELAQRDNAIAILLEEKNKNKTEEYHKALNKYTESRDHQIHHMLNMEWIRQTTIIICCLIYLIMAIVISYLVETKRLAGIILVIAISFPLFVDFLTPFINKYILNAIKWIFSKNERNLYKENLIENYEIQNPKPTLILSKAEEYLHGPLQ